MSSWLDPLIQAISGNSLANDPMYAYGLKTAMSPTQPMDDSGSFWSGFLPAIAQGFGGGLAAGIGKQRFLNEQNTLGDELTQFASTPAADQASYLDSTEYLKDFGPQIKLAKLAQKQEQQDALLKAALSQPGVTSGLSITTDENGNLKVVKNEDQGRMGLTRSTSVFGDTGIPTLQDRELQDIQSLTPLVGRTQAATTARANTEAFRRSAGKELMKAQDMFANGTLLDSTIQTLEKAIPDLGYTGGPGSETLAAAHKAGSAVLGPLAPDSWGKQSAARALVSSEATRALNSLKTTGAVSDFETKNLLQALVGIDKTPEQNAALLGRLKTLRDYYLDYSDFTSALIDEFGTATQAQKLWGKYTKDVSQLPEDQRPSWRDYAMAGGFGRGGAQLAQTPPSISDVAATQAAGGAPAVGQMFMGKPVLSVRKIR